MDKVEYNRLYAKWTPRNPVEFGSYLPALYRFLQRWIVISILAMVIIGAIIVIGPWNILGDYPNGLFLGGVVMLLLALASQATGSPLLGSSVLWRLEDITTDDFDTSESANPLEINEDTAFVLLMAASGFTIIIISAIFRLIL
jgi:hypothetical protein